MKWERNAKRHKGESPLKIVGKTEDGKSVVQGIFQISSSYTGLPLEIILDQLLKQNIIIDWLDYYLVAVESGMKPDRILLRIKNSIGDVQGSTIAEETIKQLKYCLTNYETNIRKNA